MRVLVACEFSGIVRDAFIRNGHDAISCDLLPTERPGPHVQGDVRPLLRERWDMVVAHPPCTYLCNSGVRWLHERPGRWEKMVEAADFFCECLDANSRYVAVENPTMHKHARTQIGGIYPAFYVQPWEHGHEESKRTCFWAMGGIPPLMPTKVMRKREGRIHKLPPSKDRGMLRSRTFEGIADAMAEQWGKL